MSIKISQLVYAAVHKETRVIFNTYEDIAIADTKEGVQSILRTWHKIMEVDPNDYEILPVKVHIAADPVQKKKAKRRNSGT